LRTPFHLAVWACILVIFSPRRFLTLQDQTTKGMGIPAATNDESATVVCRAFWMSLILVTFSALIGAVAGIVFGEVFGAAAHRSISWLQIVGTSLLLWGTIFVRGWEIQTSCGYTLVEMVNRWLYRTLYCVGTAILVCSLTWPQA
jgi:hypothetical protein